MCLDYSLFTGRLKRIGIVAISTVPVTARKLMPIFVSLKQTEIMIIILRFSELNFSKPYKIYLLPLNR